jgi:hypothetical protein
VAAKNEIGKSAECLWRGIGVDRGERSGVAGVQRIEQGARLDSANLAQDDPVGPPPLRATAGEIVHVWNTAPSEDGVCGGESKGVLAVHESRLWT